MKLGRFPVQTQTMNQVVVESTVGLAYVATLLAVFAVVSLAFSTVGIYGVMVWMVQERTREIGMRVALGAREWEVVRMMTGNGAVVALAGVGAGILGGLGALLTVVSAIACWIPARRAARIDPLAALRTQ